MTQREKLLAAIVVGTLLLFGGSRGWKRFSDSLASKRADVFAAREKLGDARLQLERGRKAVEQLEKLQERSLPANRDVAASLYRVWLEQRLKEAGLAVDDIVSDQRTPGTDAYSTVGFTVTAHGTLKQVSSLLFAYYRSPLLQQITRLQLRPTGTDTSQLGVTLQTEALILPGTTREDLPDGTSNRLAKDNADDYIKAIGERNLFATYTPPRPPGAASETARKEPPPKPPFDDAKFAFVTGIVNVGGRPQAWITVRTTGEVLRLYEGDAVKVGLFDGKIVSIEPRAIVLKSGDDEVRIEVGHNLRDAKGKPGAKTETEAS